jgi:hypothetical protein
VRLLSNFKESFRCGLVFCNFVPFVYCVLYEIFAGSLGSLLSFVSFAELDTDQFPPFFADVVDYSPQVLRAEVRPSVRTSVLFVLLFKVDAFVIIQVGAFALPLRLLNLFILRNA